MVFDETEARLKNAVQNQHEYQPNKIVSKKLEQKTLVAIVGPAAIGKTTVMKAVETADERFGRTGSITTREPREGDDPDMYRYVSHDENGLPQLLDQIEAGELVQYTVHPTSQKIYGTDLERYANEFNMIDALSGSVDGFKKLPFGKHVIIGLAADSKSWQTWFNERYPANDNERAKRLAEAVISLEWCLNQPENEITWVENTAGDVNVAAKNIIAASEGNNTDKPKIQSDPKQLLERAKSMS